MTHSHPDSADAWISRGQAFIEAGQTHSAPRCFARATQLEPRNPGHWARLGKVLLSLRQFEPAQDALRQACNIDGALAAYALARQAEPENLNCAVAEALLLPPIYRDTTDLQQWRSRFEDGLARLHAEQPKHPGWDDQILGLEWENFSLAHQGGDDRDLQTRYAEFLAILLSNAVPRLQRDVDRSMLSGPAITSGAGSSTCRETDSMSGVISLDPFPMD